MNQVQFLNENGIIPLDAVTAFGSGNGGVAWVASNILQPTGVWGGRKSQEEQVFFVGVEFTNNVEVTAVKVLQPNNDHYVESMELQAEVNGSWMTTATLSNAKKGWVTIGDAKQSENRDGVRTYTN